MVTRVAVTRAKVKAALTQAAVTLVVVAMVLTVVLLLSICGAGGERAGSDMMGRAWQTSWGLAFNVVRVGMVVAGDLRWLWLRYRGHIAVSYS